MNQAIGLGMMGFGLALAYWGLTGKTPRGGPITGPPAVTPSAAGAAGAPPAPTVGQDTTGGGDWPTGGPALPSTPGKWDTAPKPAR